ncbi:chromosome transmission fidelity protein 1, partial [Pancytospora epiphaga]
EELIVDKKLGQRNDLDAFFEFAKFLKLLTYSDNDGRVFYSTNKIRFTPLNPKMYFEEVKKCKSVIFAGGTMEPISQLKAIFPEIKYKCYPPISSNFFSLIISETVTKKPINLDYKNRVEILDDVLNTLVTLTNPIRTGGIIIFLPSKQFLEMIQQSEVVKSFRRKLYFETDKVFDSFKKDPQILLAVMGGRLSEGINFSDDLCRLVIVVGVPFPTNNLEFEERCKYNKDYAVQSAMNVVNQSIGRALRHKDDYAAIVLLDMRYCSLKTHLSQWIGAKTCISKPIEALIKINQFLTRNSLKKTTS